MKALIDIRNKGKLTDNDIIIFKDGKWEVIDKTTFLGECDKRIRDLNKELDDLKDSFKSFKDKVNEKLEEYHNLLQVLSKGEE